MDKDEGLYYQLEDYLDGKLPEKDYEELKRRIATEEQVAEQFALVRLERELAGLMADKELEAKMKQWSEEEAGKRRKRWLFGLLLAFLAVATAYWMLSPRIPGPHQHEEEISEGKQPDEAAPIPSYPEERTPAEDSLTSGQQLQPSEKERATPPAPSKTPPVATNRAAPKDGLQQLALATAAATSPIGNIGIRSKSSPAAGAEEPSLEKGFRLMGEDKLPEARQVLESIPAEPRGLYLNARQYLAYTCFEQQDYKAAIPIFEELIEIGYVDEDKMKWYLALSYLCTNQTGKGLPLAREVADNEKEAELQKAAQELLQSIGEK